MKITYYTRVMIGEFKCIDIPHETYVDELAFQQGELYYFRQGRFNYIALSKGRDGEWRK